MSQPKIKVRQRKGPGWYLATWDVTRKSKMVMAMLTRDKEWVIKGEVQKKPPLDSIKLSQQEVVDRVARKLVPLPKDPLEEMWEYYTGQILAPFKGKIMSATIPRLYNWDKSTPPSMQTLKHGS